MDHPINVSFLFFLFFSFVVITHGAVSASSEEYFASLSTSLL